MAGVLKLVWGATELSLQGGASGWQLEEWQPKVAEAGRGAGPVTEELVCLVTGSNHDNLATQLQALHAMQARARAYSEDATATTPVWLHAKLDGETGERRALVRRIGATFSSGWFSAEIVSYLCMAGLTIEREPLWEATAQATEVSTSGASSLGGTWDYTSAGDVGGDAPARPSLLLATGSSNTLNEFWLGFRSAAKHPTVSLFAPRWEIEAGTPAVGGETTESSDATASPGSGTSKATVAFTDATWKLRTRLYPLASNPTSQFGRFLLLLRAKVDSGTVADVKLKCGYVNYLPLEMDAVRISATTWTLYELGQVTLPFRAVRAVAGDVYDELAEVDVWARRVSGSGNLELDCIVVVPADELLLRVSQAQVTASGGDALSCAVGMTPEGSLGAMTYGYGVTDDIAAAGAASGSGSLPLGVPVGDGRLIVAAAQSNNAHALADTVNLTLRWWARFASLRGAG